jgi:hypothetical protein
VCYPFNHWDNYSTNKAICKTLRVSSRSPGWGKLPFPLGEGLGEGLVWAGCDFDVIKGERPYDITTNVIAQHPSGCSAIITGITERDARVSSRIREI